jgi:peptidoglycan biosynthesis protein MviN/MurJ (putative lipid II flippase)
MLGGLVMQSLVVLIVGASAQTDAFFAAATVHQIVLAICMGSLIHVLVPLFAGQSVDDLEQDAWTVFAALSLVVVPIAALLYLTAAVWVGWLFPGFGGATRTLAIQLTRVQLIAGALAIPLVVEWAVWRARGSLVGPEIAAVVATWFSVIVMFWALPRYGVAAAAWVTVFRTGLQLLVLSAAMGRPRRPVWTTPVIGHAAKRLAPLLMGAMYFKAEPAVDRYLASMAGAGGLSLLYFVQAGYLAISQLLNSAITVPTMTLLSLHARKGDWVLFRSTYRQRTLVALGTSACVIGAMVIVGHPVLQIAFGSRLQAADINLMWWLFLALAGALVGGATGQILMSTFYARGDTATATRIGVVAFTIGILLKVAGFFQFGLIGLAGATSLFYALTALAEFVIIERIAGVDECSRK